MGRAPGRPEDPSRSVAGFCEGRVAPNSVYEVLHREGARLFPEEMFADLYDPVAGRPSVPPSLVATVMVLQRLEGCSDREAVDRVTFDLRWKYAAGGLAYDYPGFVHTVLVDMRARLARSQRPDRVFERVLEVAGQAGLVGRRRVLDSTPIYDAVATMDTVTLLRSAVRGLLAAAGKAGAGAEAGAGEADGGLEARLRALPARDDDYSRAGKPACDWADPEARQELVDALARDAAALLAALDGRELEAGVAEAAALLATVAGQDLEQGADGVFRIARKVARNRVVSTADPEARHGHKTAARGFDGYKGHIAEDPDSEIITATAATAGNVGDAEAAEALLAGDLLPEPAGSPGSPGSPGQAAAVEPAEPAGIPDDVQQPGESPEPAGPAAGPEPAEPPGQAAAAEQAEQAEPAGSPGSPGSPGQAAAAEPAGIPDDVQQPGESPEPAAEPEQAHPASQAPAAYGDAAYGSGALLDRLERAGVGIRTKVQPPAAPAGHFSKDDFTLDLRAGTATCPAGVAAAIRPAEGGGGQASFGPACAACPLAAQCTTAKAGRTVTVGPYEEQLQRARTAQADPAWQADYKATRPKVERKLGHLMRRRHGGRRARVRGRVKVAADFALLAAAANVARLAALGLTHTDTGWAADG